MSRRGEAGLKVREIRMSSDKPLPRLYVDFNEMLAPDLVLLSRRDAKPDANGEMIHLYEGLAVSIFSDDVDDQGQPDNLVAVGVVERNQVSSSIGSLVLFVAVVWLGSAKGKTGGNRHGPALV